MVEMIGLVELQTVKPPRVVLDADAIERRIR
jgi:hypothetical protein